MLKREEELDSAFDEGYVDAAVGRPERQRRDGEKFNLFYSYRDGYKNGVEVAGRKNLEKPMAKGASSGANEGGCD